jgi:hypothetical protein
MDTKVERSEETEEKEDRERKVFKRTQRMPDLSLPAQGQL